MQYLKRVFYVLLIALVFLTGCAVNAIDSDFPPVHPDEEYFPLKHFEHLTDFRHLQADWPLLFSEDMTRC